MIVRELVTLLGVRTNQGDIRRAEGGMARLAGAAKAAMAAFASFKLAQWAKGAAEQVANLGDKFDKMSLRTGETATELQGLSHAATLSGTNLGTMEAGIRRLQNATLEAAEGVKRYKVEFKRLGIDVKNSDGTLKSFAQLLPEMADGMEKLKTDTEKSAVAQRLMGRSGTQALPLLKQGSAAIREMIGEVEELGAVLEKDLIDASTKYIDNQARVALINQSVKNSIARGLLPAFISMQEGLLKWWKANQKIINQNLEVVFRSLGGVIRNVSSFFGKLYKIFVKFSAFLDPMQRRILKLVGLIGVLAAVTLLPGGSILLVLALMALLIDDFETWRKGGKSAIGEIIKAFEELVGIDFKKQDLRDALEGLALFAVDMGKDSTKAWEDLWEATLIVLRGYFGTFWDWVKERSGSYWGPVIRKQVNDFKTWLSSAWGSYWVTLFQDLYKNAKDTWKKIKDDFIKFVDDITKHFTEYFIDKISKSLKDTFGVFGKIKNLFNDEDEDTSNNKKDTTKGAKKLLNASTAPTSPAMARGRARFSSAPIVVNMTSQTDMKVEGGGTDSAETIAQKTVDKLNSNAESERRIALKQFSAARAS